MRTITNQPVSGVGDSVSPPTEGPTVVVKWDESTGIVEYASVMEGDERVLLTPAMFTAIGDMYDSSKYREKVVDGEIVVQYVGCSSVTPAP